MGISRIPANIPIFRSPTQKNYPRILYHMIESVIADTTLIKTLRILKTFLRPPLPNEYRAKVLLKFKPIESASRANIEPKRFN